MGGVPACTQWLPLSDTRPNAALALLPCPEDAGDNGAQGACLTISAAGGKNSVLESGIHDLLLVNCLVWDRPLNLVF